VLLGRYSLVRKTTGIFAGKSFPFLFSVFYLKAAVKHLIEAPNGFRKI
jgi:hypothetical protein